MGVRVAMPGSYTNICSHSVVMSLPLFMVGHPPVDPVTGAATAAAGQTQVDLEAARAALDPDRWRLLVAEHRPRPAGSGLDAVIRAQRRV
jgi:hypothetical protein